LKILPSIRFEFTGGTEMISPRGSKTARAAFTKDYIKRRTDEHRTEVLKGIGTGNAMTQGNFYKEILVQ
jgi:hypothetical protein